MNPSSTAPDGPPAEPPDRERWPSRHPDLDWAIATGFAYLRPGDWVPLLVEFETREFPDGSVLREFSRGDWLRELRDWLYVPPVFAEQAARMPALDRLGIAVVLLHREHAAEVVRHSQWHATIRRAELGPPVFLNEKLAVSAELRVAPDSAQGAGLAHAGGRRAVIGVIDQGIAFANARFRSAGGTRIAYLWQQEFSAGFSPTSLGTEITADEIDQALAAANGDEDAVYRTLGGLRFGIDGYKPLARRRTHGTHVLDSAAGADIAADVRDRPIIAVDMPEQAIGDPAGSTLVAHALWGLYYILLRAQSLVKAGETLPVIVNISYGPHEGPHDGRALFEVVADLLIDLTKGTDTPLQVVLAAGNSRQARVHAVAGLAGSATRTLHWRLQPCGRTPSAMQLWWPAGRPLGLTLNAPTGVSIHVSSTVPVDRHLSPEGVVFAAYQGTDGPRNRALLSIAPTAPDPRLGSAHPVAPSGIWSVDLVNEAQAPFAVQAWIRRGDTPPGRRAKGRQSYFDEPDYPRHGTTRPVHYDTSKPVNPSAVRRLGTVSGIATGKRTIVVGSYRRSDDTPAPYSSAGPHDNGQRDDNAPSLLARSDDSPVLRGVAAAGTRSGTCARMNGTSAAAPRVTRALAEQWIDKGTLPNVAGLALRTPQAPGVPLAELQFVAGRGLLP